MAVVFLSSQPEPNTLMAALTRLGYTTSLNFCLDAGDLVSYSGSGQTWIDRSGSGNDYYRGLTSSAEADDPTYNNTGELLDGTATYWSFDGGDYFVESTGTQTYAEPWHKASATYSLMFLMYLPTISAELGLFSTKENGATLQGMELVVQANNTLKLYRSLSSANTFWSVSTSSLADNSWHFVVMTHTDTEAPKYYINGAAANNGDATLSSSATGAATSLYTIAGGNYGGAFPNGAKLVCTAGWSRILSSAEITAIYNEMKLRVTSLP